jgi:hypothetical protein
MDKDRISFIYPQGVEGRVRGLARRRQRTGVSPGHAVGFGHELVYADHKCFGKTSQRLESDHCGAHPVGVDALSNLLDYSRELFAELAVKAHRVPGGEVAAPGRGVRRLHPGGANGD